MSSSVERNLDELSNEDYCSRSTEVSDEALVERFILGSSVSFELLVQRYKRKIFEFIYFQINQNQHDAEDLTQDVFIALYKKADRFRQESTFSSYLYSMAKNIVFNHIRAKQRRLSLTRIFQRHVSNTSDELQQESMASKDKRVINIAFKQLKLEERQIIYLCDKEGFSYKQISEILNIKLGTVRSRLNSARNNLINALKGENHDM